MLWAFLAGGMTLCLAGEANAQTINISQRLHFGGIALRGAMNAGSRITVSADDGSLNPPPDPAYMVLDSNTREGVVELTGFDTNTQLDLNITFDPDPLNITCSCAEPGFQLTNFTLGNVPVITNGDGDGSFSFGGSLIANGGVYGDASYTGTLTVNVELVN